MVAASRRAGIAANQPVRLSASATEHSPAGQPEVARPRRAEGATRFLSLGGSLPRR